MVAAEGRTAAAEAAIANATPEALQREVAVSIKMMSFVLKPRNLVLNMMDCVLNTRGCVLKPMNSVLKPMNSVLKPMNPAGREGGIRIIMHSVFKMMDVVL